MVLEKKTSSACVEKRKTHPESTESSPATDGQDSDSSLVALVKQGVPWASERLVKRHYSKAHGLAFQMCDGNTEEAQDVTQQAFLKALHNIRQFKGGATFKTWFYRILVNTCRDARRRRRRWLGLFARPQFRNKDGEPVSFSADDFPDETTDHDPESSWQKQQLRRDIQQSLAKLPEKQRLVFQLKVLQELSIPEIAQILSLAPGTVKSHLFRATRNMRMAMADWKEAVL